MKRNKSRSQNNSNTTKNTTKLLLAFAEMAETIGDQLGAFLLSGGSVSQLKRNLAMIDKEYSSSFQGLCRHGYIKKINEDQFLITPKAYKKIRVHQINVSDWESGGWDGTWKIAAFDIPDDKTRERNILRSVLRRKGFIGIQNSVFISPYADFEALAKLREDLEIEKYVSFFTAKSYKTDDDSKLRDKFNLN